MQTEKPDWAPDNCPPNVVQLIEHDQVIENLKLRGLASADSKVYHAAVARLKFHLDRREATGYARGRRHGYLVAIAASLLTAGIGLALSQL